MEREELELFLHKRIKLTKKNADGRARYFTGEIQQLSVDSLLLKDKFECLILIPYRTIDQVETVKEGDF